MSIAHGFAASIASAGVTRASTTWTETQELELNWDFSLATNTNYDLTGAAITISKIKSIFMVFDQDTTIKTNSTGSPQETLTFKANVPLIWDVNMPVAIGTIFAGNITHFYVTTTTTTAVKIYITLDS